VSPQAAAAAQLTAHVQATVPATCCSAQLTVRPQAAAAAAAAAAAQLTVRPQAAAAAAAAQLTVRPYAIPAMYRFLAHFSLTWLLGKALVRRVSCRTHHSSSEQHNPHQQASTTAAHTAALHPCFVDTSPCPLMWTEKPTQHETPPHHPQKKHAPQPALIAHLRLVHGPPAWHAQHKGALVRCGCAGGDAEACVPAAVDALRGVLEVQLHTLHVTGSDTDAVTVSDS
jgi:hypothetical protein